MSRILTFGWTITHVYEDGLWVRELHSKDDCLVHFPWKEVQLYHPKADENTVIPGDYLLVRREVFGDTAETLSIRVIHNQKAWDREENILKVLMELPPDEGEQ